MNRISISEAAEILRTHDDYLILTHSRADGDTIGSAAALTSALRRMGKSAAMFDNPDITEKFIPFTSEYIAPESFESKFVIAVDIAGEKLFPIGFEGNADLCIDHHPSNTGYAAATLVMPEKAACGEIIIFLIKELCGNITKSEADLLYIAVSTDTGCFQYANTTAETHRAAAELIELGADSAELSRLFFRTFSKSRLTLEGYIFSSLRSYMDNRINIAVITNDMLARSGAVEDDLDDLANLAGRVRGNKAAVTIREIENRRSKISLRTTDEINASEICAHFGGGGHAMAAGCEMDCLPEEAVQKILPLIEKAMK